MVDGDTHLPLGHLRARGLTALKDPNPEALEAEAESPAVSCVEEAGQLKKLSLSEWALMGELVGTFAVFVSLLFVVYSINQNTAALQGTTENVLFERIGDLSAQVIGDPTLAEIIVKKKQGEPELTPVEMVRWEKYQLVLLDMWALSFNRYRRGLLAEDQWQAWDGYFREVFSTGAERMPEEQWTSLAYGYDPVFWDHVGAALYDR